MRIINLQQGSAQWLAHRATKFNASDAPAMLGESPHCTRAELLRRMATGITPEVDGATQRRFDAGHQVEPLLRAHGEQIVGEPLHPFVGVADFDDRLSASFDGCTFVGDEIAECKLLNARLRAAFADMETIAPEHREQGAGKCLPVDYRIQMEQQARIAGAARVLFLAGELREDGTLGDVLSCWYYPDMTLWMRVLGGWEQFGKDLADYVPTAAAEPLPAGRAPDALPALRIEVTGMVTASNLDAFKTHALAVFGGINTSLRTDNDFADAERTVRWCGDVEERLAAAKQHALSQTESIDALFRAIDEISAEARRVRLDLDKKVKAKKEERRGEIVAGGVAALREHCAALTQRLGRPYLPLIPADFAGVIKGKKSLASMEDAVSTELARAKIEANRIADGIQVNLAALVELASEHKTLFADTAQLVLKAPDDCRAVIVARIAEHQAAEQKRLDAERERIRAEEAARIEREQQAATRAEEQRQRDEAREQERQRAADTAEKERLTRSTPELAQGASPSPAVVPIRPAVATAMPATLNLGAINARLGFTMNAEFVRQLGIEPAATEKSAKLYTEGQYQLICEALVAHVRTAQNRLQAA